MFYEIVINVFKERMKVLPDRVAEACFALWKVTAATEKQDVAMLHTYHTQGM